MTPRRKAYLKNWMREQVRYEPNTRHHIPDLLFKTIILHGVSLNTAKQVFLEIAKEENLYLVPVSTMWLEQANNLEGKRGLKRKLKWYPLVNGAYRSHFYYEVSELKKPEGECD
ncbi:MAG: hypothetical protein N2V75_00565 [Methanophagales archaeon]|nr:hypothetical protein [Methanophagales archaeon]